MAATFQAHTDNQLLQESDLDPFMDIEAGINRLRAQRNSIILAHYYQEEAIQDLADFVGDSLDLSRKAADADADVIVFCGVRFMAEVAKILSPQKPVLLPDMDAGCSLEESCQPEEFRAFREQHPDHIAISYINCSAEIKALSDIIVTSSNAEYIVKNLPADRPVLFAPDRHLGAFIQNRTGREMLIWQGSCVVHEAFSERELVRLKTRHPDTPVTAHPECPRAILQHADHIGSTSAMLKFVTETPNEKFIVATEPHLIHQMRKSAPGKIFIPAPGNDGGCACANCPYMERNTLEKLYLCLANMAPRIELSQSLIEKARAPLENMLALSPPVVKADPSKGALPARPHVA